MVLDFDTFFCLKAQSDDDDVGPDDVAVNVEGRDGFMDAFFGEVNILFSTKTFQNWDQLTSFLTVLIGTLKKKIDNLSSICLKKYCHLLNFLSLETAFKSNHLSYNIYL